MKWRTLYDGFRAMGNSRLHSMLWALTLTGMEPIDRISLAASYVARYQTDSARPCVVLESKQVKALKDMRRSIDNERRACRDSFLLSIEEATRPWRRKPRFDVSWRKRTSRRPTAESEARHNSGRENHTISRESTIWRMT